VGQTELIPVLPIAIFLCSTQKAQRMGQTLRLVLLARRKEVAVTFDELRQRLKNERERLSKGMEQVRASAPPAGEAKEGSPYGTVVTVVYQWL
jgi:Sec-independent protein translocase protein TatA